MTRSGTDSDFESFLAEVQGSGDPYIPPKRYASLLGVTHGALADMAHVPKKTVARMPHSPQLQKFLRAAVDVLIAATRRRGDHRGILFWFRNAPVPPFDYKTAEVVVSEGRADELLRYIETLEPETAPITCTLLPKMRTA